MATAERERKNMLHTAEMVELVERDRDYIIASDMESEGWTREEAEAEYVRLLASRKEQHAKTMRDWIAAQGYTPEALMNVEDDTSESYWDES